VPQTATGICVSIFRPDGEHLYISSLGAIAALNEGLLKDKMWPILAGSEVVLLTGLFVLPGLGAEGAARCFTMLKEEGIRTALDVGWDTAGWSAETVEAVRGLLTKTDIFLPNLAEARAIGRGSTVEEVA